ncbi:MAG: DMT family transporter [Candidatus Hodarchaeota archaeon]
MAKSAVPAYLSLIIAAVGFGSIPVFSFYLSLLGVSSLQQALFRAIFTVIFLFLGLGIAFSFRDIQFQRKHTPHFILYGLIGIALSIIAYISAIAIGTPVVVAVSLTYLYPALTLILSRIFLKELFTLPRLIAVPLSIVGAIIVSLPLTPELEPVPVVGIILSFLNGVFAACYMVLGRKWGGHEGYAPTVTTFWGYFFAMLWMAPLFLIISVLVPDPRIVGFQLVLPPVTWLLLVGFALFATAIPYTLTNVGVERIDASAASILLLLDPVSAVVFGFLFLSQGLAFWQAIGASLILFATVLIAIEPRLQRQKQSKLETPLQPDSL